MVEEEERLARKAGSGSFCPAEGMRGIPIDADADLDGAQLCGTRQTSPTNTGVTMYNGLSSDELQRQEDDAFIKPMDRKWLLENAGVELRHDKLFCFYKWQLEQVQDAKAVAVAEATNGVCRPDLQGGKLSTSQFKRK